MCIICVKVSELVSAKYRKKRKTGIACNTYLPTIIFPCPCIHDVPMSAKNYDCALAVTLWPYRNYSQRIECFFHFEIDDSRFVFVISVVYGNKANNRIAIVRVTMRLYNIYTSLSSSIRISAIRLHVIVYFSIANMSFVKVADTHTHTRTQIRGVYSFVVSLESIQCFGM